MNNKIIVTRANEPFSSQVIACSFILQSLGTLTSMPLPVISLPECHLGCGHMTARQIMTDFSKQFGSKELSHLPLK